MAKWPAGEFDVVVSPALLEELERAFGYPKLRKRMTTTNAVAFVAIVREAADIVDDPPAPPMRSPDPGDDYLLALAEQTGAVLVSGDRHLLGLASTLPVRTPRAFLELLDDRS